jgi:thiamine thiazole synthase
MKKRKHVSNITETRISETIVDGYHQKLFCQINSDVVIVGAGPSGLTAALYLASAGKNVTVLEKRLAPGGGMWGGAMGMNDVVVQQEAISILDTARVRHGFGQEGLHRVDAAELACALCLEAIRRGATLLNLVTLEDVCLHRERVTGVVINRTGLAGVLPVDPLVLSAAAVIDATGHEAIVVERLRSRGLLQPSAEQSTAGEGPMDAAAGEAFVVDRVAEVYPGAWVTGMAVTATFGGPRMGPIFGGMLLSGKKVAELIRKTWA